MSYQHIKLPETGSKITVNSDFSLNVPAQPIIPFIEGDGIGVDITPVMLKVIDAAVEKAYGGAKKISWMEIYTGEKAADLYDGDWFPAETLDAIKEYAVAIKGPLTTPVGGGFRSLNVALRQELDLYVCLRPVRWFEGVPSPVREPHKTNMVIFRENAEDIYAGIEWKAGSVDAKRVISFLQDEMGVTKIRFDQNCGIGVKPVSEQGTKRLVRNAIQYTIDQDLPSVTLVHKGNIMKYTEGGFRDWGYELVEKEFGAVRNNEGFYEITVSKKINGIANKLIVKDMIADAFLQDILLKPKDHDVVATLNLNGDYISDALAAQVGGIEISPGANLSDTTAIFEATHGTAPLIAGMNIANPSSIILSAQMMLEYIGWDDASEIVNRSYEKTLKQRKMTSDLAAQVDGCKSLTTKEFASALITNM